MSTSDDRTDKLARLERLRKLGVQRGAHDINAPLPTSERAVGAMHIAAPQPTFYHSPTLPTLPGEPVDTPHGPAWMRTVRYPLAERPDLAALLHIETEALAAAGRAGALAALDPARAAFIDTETTGLTPDTGTYTFLIGIGTFERPGETDRGHPDTFVVRQFFMRHPGEERAQLHLVEEALAPCTGIVSFNGRGFDLPMLQNRFILARRLFPWIRLPHFDLLPAARRVWRGRLDSCRLSSLEEHILGVQRSEEDVPGYLIPDIYRQYYLSGVVTDMLVRVFYHNLIDITSMPLLAARLGQLYQAAGLEERLKSLHPAERASLARAYVDLGWIAAGERAYHAAIATAAADAQRAQLYRDL
ncbi:MAG: ribonuclease H-like domain-containing protein, partial [Anaerolineae bacterium]|nr:ribonuclease H-like domain-containing protein [Anaerolineae bacterium]